MNGEQVSSEVITPAPIERPMEQAPSQPLPIEPKKEKRVGVIVGIIIAVLVLLISGVVLAVVLSTNKPDPVAAAINKIMSDQAPTSVSVDGDISISTSNKLSPFYNINIYIDSDLMPASMINKTKATATLDLRNAGELTLDLDEVYAGNGDLYFKINGIVDALENSNLLYLFGPLLNQMTKEIDCDDNEDCQNKKWQSKTYEVIDGEWIKISAEEMNAIFNNIRFNDNLSCVVDLVSNLNKNNNSAVELYRKNPFIKSTKENVNLASKNYPVYQVIIDDENFANFVNSIQNSYISKELYSCLGIKDNLQVSKEDISEIISELPKVYVEIDDESNFTRIYFMYNLEDSESTITTDLGFSYPRSINIPEPEEYKDFSSAIQEIFTGMHMLQN